MPMPSRVMAKDKDHRRFNLASSRLLASSADSSQFYLKSCLRMSKKSEDLFRLMPQKKLLISLQGNALFPSLALVVCSPGSFNES
jgi:hypothetical protein